jgi:scyllo-inositol 2-dehydrogenase (NADP+)
VVTANQERAERARAAHPGAQVVPDVETVWESAADHDLVVVAAPNRMHVPLGLAALEAGLPVVIDKPLAPSVADARRLEASARERGLMLAAFHNRRWDGDMLTLRRLLREDALGQVFRFESRFERWRPTPKAAAWREVAGREEAGGVLFDLGSHLIDQALLLFGRPHGVYAEVELRRPGVQVDDDSFVALAHRDGVRSHLWMSQAAAQEGPRMRALGSQAGYTKWGLDVQEAALKAGERPGTPGWGVEPEEAWGKLGAGDELVPVETEPGDYAAFYRGVAAALRAEASPPVSAAEAVATLEVIEAAFESARSGETVPLGGTDG